MYDLVVIGAGPGGYVAAIRAAQLKLKVALIDKRSSLGGTCLNIGCIPSKTLLEATDIYYKALTLGKDFGQDLLPSFSFHRLMEKKDEVVLGLTKGVASLMQKNGIDVFTGEAKLIHPEKVQVGDQEITGQSILLATGSESISLPFLPYNGKNVISSTEALSLKERPQTMIVIGGGVIGVELASVYNRMGTQVVVVEKLDQLIYPMDKEIAKALHSSLRRQGIQFLLGKSVQAAEVQEEGVTLNLGDETISAEMCLVAVGRKPFSQGLGLDEVGVKQEKGFVVVDDNFRTSIPSIFAIGDLIRGPMLAHRASEEGIALAEYLAGEYPRLNYLTIPNVIYTNPEVASVGWTEEEARQHNLEPLVGMFSMRGNPRARASFIHDGFVKMVADKSTHKVVGCHIVCPHASELIGQGVLAIACRATIDQVANAPQAHPTLSEAIKEAALNALDRAIHA